MGFARGVLCGMAVILSALSPASAGHVRPGLWHLTSTIRYVGVDKIPQFVLGKLAAQGIAFPTRPQTTEANRCITPQDAAIDRLPRLTEDNGACDALTMEATSNGYSGRALCRSYLDGRIWLDLSFRDDAHYDGQTVFKGRTYGMAMETRTNFSGEWSAADCNAPAAP